MLKEKKYQIFILFWMKYRSRVENMEIGQVVSASVLDGIEIKLNIENPENLKVGYPVIVEGKEYRFYCVVEDIYTPKSKVIERIAGLELEKTIPIEAHETPYGIPLSCKAKLKPICLIDRNNNLREPETIPPYLAKVRLAIKEDVEKVYSPSEKTLPLGNLRGVKFEVGVDFERLTEKPFAIFGRTGVGKSILCKIVCNSIIAKDVGSVFIFDMHQEYGTFSKTDNTPGLKYFFPDKVEVFTLDPEENKEAFPFLIDQKNISPSDIIVAFQDLSESMIDALYVIERKRGEKDLVTAIKEADPDEYADKIHTSSLLALKRRIERLKRFKFIKPCVNDSFSYILSLIRTKKSIVLDFGRYGTNQMAYLFIANIIARRLYSIYTESPKTLPKLILFLEEAHKFLDPKISNYTIFDKLARETRKFNLILAIVDQRPSNIDEDVRSQLANRLILSLKEPNDVSASLSGVPDRPTWERIVSTMPPRNVLLIGDAIAIPTVVEVLEYTIPNMKRILLESKLSTEEINRIVERIDDIF
ncbi:MAG: hypothetical protein DRN25_00760 [Thermoplasmata archaeon]|nr:MAG: hypothetical protein DRN25_00760 [Thermoplasmata archaeon]